MKSTLQRSRGTPMTMETPWNPRRCDTRDTNSTINPHHHRSSLLCFNDSAPVQMPISIFETTAWAAKWWPSSNVKKFWWGPKLTPGTNRKCWLRRCSLRNCPEIGHSLWVTPQISNYQRCPVKEPRATGSVCDSFVFWFWKSWSNPYFCSNFSAKKLRNLGHPWTSMLLLAQEVVEMMEGIGSFSIIAFTWVKRIPGMSGGNLTNKWNNKHLVGGLNPSEK